MPLRATQHIRPDFGQFLKTLIDARCATQKEFAEAAGIDQKRISEYVTGPRRPDRETYDTIKRTLHALYPLLATQRNTLDALFVKHNTNTIKEVTKPAVSDRDVGFTRRVGDRDLEFHCIRLTGDICFSPEQVKTSWAKPKQYYRPQQLQDLVIKMWPEFRRVHEHSIFGDTNNSHARLVSIVQPVHPPVLELTFQETTYFDKWMSNLKLDEPLIAARDGSLQSIRDYFALDAEKLTDLQTSPLANPLGVSLLLVNRKKGVAILQIKSKKVGIRPGNFTATAAGHIITCYDYSAHTQVDEAQRRHPDLDPRGVPDPFATAIREAQEECGVLIDRSRITCVSIVVDLRAGNPQMLCVAETDGGALELHTAPKEGLAEVEQGPGLHATSFFEVPIHDPQQLGRFLGENLEANQMVTTAYLLLRAAETFYPEQYAVRV